ncbi:MAG: hypothetical protein WA063_04070 [Minisyncoccia bacterium]
MSAATKEEISPVKIYELMEKTSRVRHGESDNEIKLLEIANELSRCKKDAEAPKDILLSGFFLDGERHGGYEYKEGKRDFFGKGFLLYSGIMNDTGRIEKIGGYLQKSSRIEIWELKKAERNASKFIFLAFTCTINDGYVGIDNHHGTETDWELVSIRILPTIQGY